MELILQIATLISGISSVVYMIQSWKSNDPKKRKNAFIVGVISLLVFLMFFMPYNFYIGIKTKNELTYTKLENQFLRKVSVLNEENEELQDSIKTVVENSALSISDLEKKHNVEKSKLIDQMKNKSAIDRNRIIDGLVIAHNKE